MVQIGKKRTRTEKIYRVVLHRNYAMLSKNLIIVKMEQKKKKNYVNLFHPGVVLAHIIYLMIINRIRERKRKIQKMKKGTHLSLETQMCLEPVHFGIQVEGGLVVVSHGGNDGGGPSSSLC